MLRRLVQSTSRWPDWLALARLPNLPTVWSNCLAAWLLSGDGELDRFIWVCVGASFLYLGGTYLNDYFDLDFDRQHRRDRPIPAGRVPAPTVLRFGLVWLALGFLGCVWGARADPWVTILLVLAIVFYDAVHKITKLSPLLIGLCRLLLYLLAASAATGGVAGIAIWSGIAMGCYVVGLSYLARKEALRSPIRRWPLLLLAAPIGLAMLSNAPEYRHIALWLSLVFALWILPSLRHALRDKEPNVGLTVSGLLAGIVLVDLLAVAGHSAGVALVFVLFFVLAVLAQRFVPAT